MLIHQLEITNFKSYNGHHVIGPFDTHFTCIIGPNGNGKSNIIDALLFVFGFKSSKLRQDSLASLIHKSAFGHPDQCTVAVIFRESQQYTKISRTIKQSGYTYYKLNDQKINWTELRERFMSKNIDLKKNLFIILQGQVQRLCELSPDKLVQYLEYIAGSDEFKERIEEVEQLFLKNSTEKEEAQYSLSVKKKIFEKIKELAVNQTKEIIVKLKITFLQHLILKKSVINYQIQYQKTKNSEKLQVQRITLIQNQLRQIQKQQNNLKLEGYRMSKQILLNEQQLNKIDNLKEMIITKCREVNQNINFIEKDKQKIRIEIQKYQQQIQNLNRIHKNWSSIIKNFEIIKEKVTNKTKDLNKFKLCNQLLNKRLQIQKNIASHHQKLTKLQQNLSEAHKVKETSMKTISELKEVKLKTKQRVKVLIEKELEVKKCLVENEENQNDLKMKLSCESMPEKEITMKQKIISEIKLANNLKLICPGVKLKTLREGVMVESDYEDVLECVLPHLDFIVVETTQQAQQISDFLMKQKIGRMTFLIKELINKIDQKNHIHSTNSAPPNSKRLFDLCKALDEDTLNILYWALGNTLVTDKLETAMKIAYNHSNTIHRVVTIKGQFIDASGTMTCLNLKKNTNQTKQQQENHRNKIAALQKTKNNLQDQLADILNERESCRKTIEDIEIQSQKYHDFDENLLQDLEEQLKNVVKTLEESKIQEGQIFQNINKIKLNICGRKDQNEQQFYDTLQLIKDYEKQLDQVKKAESSKMIIQNAQKQVVLMKRQLQKIDIKLSTQNEEIKKLNLQKQKHQIKINQKYQQLLLKKKQKQSNEEKIRELNEQIEKIEERLGRKEMNKANGNIKLRQILKKLRDSLKQIDIKITTAKLEYVTSLKEIKDFVSQIYLNCGCLDLYFPSQQLASSNLLYQFSLITMGQKSYSFFDFCNNEELKFMKTHSMERISEENQQIQESFIFDSIDLKKIQFFLTMEKESLELFTKDQGEGLTKINYSIFQEYSEKKQEFWTCKEKYDVLDKKEQEISKELIDLRTQRLRIFQKSFNEINIELNHIYCKLTGGKAELNLVDSMNPFEGIEFSVRPVNKSWKNVNLLSGGEKTFTSLALIFACQAVKKFPFYFMDEIDAALDFKNTSLLAYYIKEKKCTQHIVISLRKNMYEESNRLVGVYKVKDQSNIIEVEMAYLRKQ